MLPKALGAIGLVGASAATLVGAPRAARAGLPGDRLEFIMYGRMGMGWSLHGQNVQGQVMNLTDHGIGGRLEEGDYVEPTIKLHVLKPEKEDKNGTWVDATLTTPMFNRNGSFMSLLANNANNTLGIELFQAFVEAGNVFVPGMSFWGGARFYRGTDVHISDYFYFNDLSGQGGGAKYKNFEVAVLAYTGEGSNYPGYNFSSTPAMSAAADVHRVRTVFTAQYKHEFGDSGNTLQGLAELHTVPAPSLSLGGRELAKADHGAVIGAKLHLEFGNGQFNDLSVRYGSRIANGAYGGAKTWQTFGPPGQEGTYEGAMGLEVVEHFLFNFGSIASLNGYGILHYDKTPNNVAGKVVDGVIVDDTGKDVSPTHVLDFAVGVRSLIYAHKQFHMVNELTYQGRKDGDRDMGTAWKFSVVPTIVPKGETIAWSRPHMRLIYTAGIYNKAAVDQHLSPYLRATGSASQFAHYIGARSEWWF